MTEENSVRKQKIAGVDRPLTESEIWEIANRAAGRNGLDMLEHDSMVNMYAGVDDEGYLLGHNPKNKQ